MCSRVPTREGAHTITPHTEKTTHGPSCRELLSPNRSVWPPSITASHLGPVISRLSTSRPSLVSELRERDLATQPPIHCLGLPKPMKPTSSSGLHLAVWGAHSPPALGLGRSALSVSFFSRCALSSSSGLAIPGPSQ